MKRALFALWSHDDAFVVSSELVLVATILVLGVIVGLATVRDQMVQELGDTAGAFSQMVQTYSFASVTGHTATIAGSSFNDLTDFCDSSEIAACDVEGPGRPAACISITEPASVESL
jgi:hypothetical protein